jgi:hypothetical protein
MGRLAHCGWMLGVDFMVQIHNAGMPTMEVVIPRKASRLWGIGSPVRGSLDLVATRIRRYGFIIGEPDPAKSISPANCQFCEFFDNVWMFFKCCKLVHALLQNAHVKWDDATIVDFLLQILLSVANVFTCKYYVPMLHMCAYFYLGVSCDKREFCYDQWRFVIYSSNFFLLLRCFERVPWFFIVLTHRKKYCNSINLLLCW